MYNNQSEFVVYFDKPQWSNFLKTLNDVISLFIMISRGEVISKKNKKNKLIPLYNYMKDNYNICNTVLQAVRQSPEQRATLLRSRDPLARPSPFWCRPLLSAACLRPSLHRARPVQLAPIPLNRQPQLRACS